MPKHDELIKSFYKNRDSKKSFDMSKYMKDKFPYLGIPKPARALLQKEFFINKAIGWSLREYSKTNQKWVRDFIDKHKDKMDRLSVREGAKYL